MGISLSTSVAALLGITAIVLIARFWMAQNKIAQSKGPESDCRSTEMLISGLLPRWCEWIINGKTMPVKVVALIIVLTIALMAGLWLCACAKNFPLIVMTGVVSSVAVVIVYRTKRDYGRLTPANSYLIIIMTIILCTTLAYWVFCFLSATIWPVPEELLNDLGSTTTLAVTMLLVLASIVQAALNEDAGQFL